MTSIWKFALAGAAFAMLAGCSSPVSTINQSCREGGGTAAACSCFTGELQKNLTPEQLNAFAANIAQSKQQNPEVAQQSAMALQEQLGMEGAMKVAGAAKQCELNTMQGL
jgi:hypothetical protein